MYLKSKKYSEKLVYLSENSIFILISFSTIILSMQIRIGILGEKMGQVNLISSILIILLVIFYLKKFNVVYMVMCVMLTLYFSVSSVFYQENFLITIKTYISFILPLIIIGLNFNKTKFPDLFRKFIKMLNIIVFIITIMGILDYFLGSKIILQLSQFMSNRMTELIQSQQNSNIYRMYSFMGHPLFNTQLYLMFYILNMLYRKYFGRMINLIFIYIIPLIGISLTASKTGLFLYIISILIINYRRIKLKYFIIVSIVSVVVVKLGIFNNTFVRLMSGSITTGRAERWIIIKKYNIFPIKFFVGYGTGFTFQYNSIIDWASSAFEYPFRMFSLELGQLMTIMIYCCIFLYPIILLIKRKNLLIIVAYLIIFIDINTYNGLSVLGDNMLLFSIFTSIILNLSSYANLRKN